MLIKFRTDKARCQYIKRTKIKQQHSWVYCYYILNLIWSTSSLISITRRALGVNPFTFRWPPHPDLQQFSFFPVAVKYCGNHKNILGVYRTSGFGALFPPRAKLGQLVDTQKVFPSVYSDGGLPRLQGFPNLSFKDFLGKLVGWTTLDNVEKLFFFPFDRSIINRKNIVIFVIITILISVAIQGFKVSINILHTTLCSKNRD